MRKHPRLHPFSLRMRTSARRMIADIEKFFSGTRSRQKRGASPLASFHHAPFLHIHGLMVRVECLKTDEAVHEFFLVLSGKCAERDHGGGRFLDLEVKPLSWEQFKTDGSVYRRVRCSYTLLRINTDWKIVVTTAHRD